MKYITKNLGILASLIMLYTLLFRFGLSSLLTVERYGWIWPIAILYGGIIFITAWTLGRREGMQNFLFDAGFRWNFTTYLVWGIASEGWFLLGFQSKYENIRVVHITLLIWGGFILVHFIIYLLVRRRRTIKGVHRKDIFE